MSGRWYVIRTLPRSEHKVDRDLAVGGWETYVPHLEIRDYLSRNTDIHLMFPGYIFVKWDEVLDLLPTLRSNRRVIGLVQFGDIIPSLSDKTMAEIIERVDLINRSGKCSETFQVGDTVNINNRLYQGFAEILDLSGQSESGAWVLIQFMGRRVRAKVPFEALQPVQRSQKLTPLNSNLRPPRRTRGRGRLIYKKSMDHELI